MRTSSITIWSPVTSPTGAPTSPARIVKRSGSPTVRPATRTLRKRPLDTVWAMMPGQLPAAA